MDTAPAAVVLEELDERECLRLLGTAHLGRIALTVGALPAVFPIHFALLGRDPVFRTGSGTKLAAGSSGHVVCLEVDDVDTECHRGWSVMVIGPTHVMTEPGELAVAKELPLRPWVGSGDAYVQIRSGLISGRRIGGASAGTIAHR
ncbi:MAG: pyridoxamine 5-phosphate oxidase-related FMN-binding protein [Ilumatobacteraceae bacterium]|nr:pyridoxamine 5-phosphate oxidase-related FMN-binding protein [Ilumatobacteraceae bacterium]